MAGAELVGTGAEIIQPVLTNFTATADPTASNDATQGYAVGSGWFNTTTQVFWRAASVGAGAASWIPMQVNDHPGYRTGEYYGTYEGAGGSATITPAIDLIYCYPYFVRENITLTALAIRVATGGTTSAFKAAIYANLRTGLRGRPTGAPLAVNNTGVATTSSTTIVDLAMAATISPGVYWFAQKHSGAVLPICYSMTSNSTINSTLLGRATIAAGPILALSLADAYANNMPTLDGTESWAAVTTSGIPVLNLKL